MSSIPFFAYTHLFRPTETPESGERPALGVGQLAN